MQALFRDRYGSPDVLSLREVPTPTPDGESVLIRVYAASVNPLDWHMLTGTPYIVRATGGFRRPKAKLIGADVAGRVEAVGANVTHFRPGDDVFGTCSGSFAEFAVAAEKSLAHKPASLTYEQAASMPIAGLTALQGLRDKGQLKAGQSVLINGASGGVGMFAVQIARAMDAEVTGVCSTANVEFVHGLGAEHVIDYRREDATASGKHYDVIIDNVGNYSFSALRRAMTREGRCVIVSGPKRNRLWGPAGAMVGRTLASRLVSQSFIGLFTSIKRDDLLELSRMVESGSVTPEISRTCTLADAPAALEEMGRGHTRGKLVVAVAH